MGPTRFPYGDALGFVNHFNYRGETAGNITGSTTPNVTLGGLFYTNNTAALTLTNFLLDDTANRLTNYEGKRIRVFFLDTATQIANAGSLFLQGTNNLIGANNNIELMFSRGSWFETDRVNINRTEVNSFVLTGASSLNMDGVRVALLNNTGSATIAISALSGGQVGQDVTFMLVGSNPVRILGNIANIFTANTNAFLVNASGAYRVIKFDNSTWRVYSMGT